MLPGKIATAFSDHSDDSPPTVRGHEPHQRSARRAVGRRSAVGCRARSRASAASTSAISSMHSGIGSSRRTSCSSRTRTVMRRTPLSCRRSVSVERQLARSRAPARAARARIGPQTAPATPGLASTHAKASVAMSTPRASASSASRSSPSKTASATQLLVRAGPLRHARAGRERLAAAVLAGEPAAGERAERDVGDPVLDAERDQLPLVPAVEQRVRVLHERRARRRRAPRARRPRRSSTGPTRRSAPRRAAPRTSPTVRSSGTASSGSWARYRSTRPTPRRARLPSSCRRIRSGASPSSPGVPVVEWKTFVVSDEALRPLLAHPAADERLARPPP